MQSASCQEGGHRAARIEGALRRCLDVGDRPTKVLANPPNSSKKVLSNPNSMEPPFGP